MRKVDESKARWIVRKMAKVMKISVRRVQQAWRRFKDADAISYQEGRERPGRRLPGCMEHSAVLAAVQGGPADAVRLEEAIEGVTGIHIPYNTIHGIMREEDLAGETVVDAQSGEEYRAD